MKAMVLAAGLGTRLKPFTFEICKPMVPVVDRPVMAHIVDSLERQGFDRSWPTSTTSRRRSGVLGDRLEYR